ncbi:hypothetical protein BEH94_09360 [Candidatus Altiarchaeales archaeon WOR_SM1_SCG]|nr:hypothetical protein BEH94_09360 [Candidatus Altiarchaeales archaeon WOR_SM1_SCG]
MIGLMDAANYAYAYGWVSALPQSLGKEIYEKLITARSIDEVVATLAGTAYSDEIQDGIKKHGDKEALVDVTAIEKAITSHYVHICKAVISALPMGVRDGARAIMMDEWDVVNLKRIARGVTIGKRGEEIISELGAVGNINETKLSEAASGDLRIALEKIRDFGYELNTNETNLFKIESELDAQLINIWLTECEKVHELRDAVRTQIDMLNLKSILRYKLGNIDASEFIENSVTGKHFHREILKEIHSAGFDAVPDILAKTPYGDTFHDAFDDFKKSGSPEKLELRVEKILSGYVIQAQPLSLNFIISYLRRMRIDARNIRVILVCKKHNIPPEEIRELLVSV